METRGGTGKRAVWSSLYQSDRPRDILGLTEAQEAKIKQFIGLTGKDQDGNESQLFVLKYEGTDAPIVTDFATTPIGTVILCPKLSAPRIYIHKAQSTTPVIGDWYYIQGTQVT